MANDIATQGLKPDLTILLDIPPEKGLVRKFGEIRDHFDIRDHFEKQVLDFHQRVREGYLKLAAGDPQHWLVIDATQSKEEIARIIWQQVTQLLASRNKE
jgi:dTMP kinase